MKASVEPTFKWSNKLRIISIKKFDKQMKKFCKENDITPTFENYLFFGWNGIVSQTYASLYIAPKEYLANSKAFNKFFFKLDHDFKRDLFENGELKQVKRELQINTELTKQLQTLMKEDSIL